MNTKTYMNLIIEKKIKERFKRYLIKFIIIIIIIIIYPIYYFKPKKRKNLFNLLIHHTKHNVPNKQNNYFNYYTNSNYSYYACIANIGKYENRYAREFVEHYISLRVEKFYLMDDNIIGGEKLLDVLQDYVDKGFVEIFYERGKK